MWPCITVIVAVLVCGSSTLRSACGTTRRTLSAALTPLAAPMIASASSRSALLKLVVGITSSCLAPARILRRLCAAAIDEVIREAELVGRLEGGAKGRAGAAKHRGDLVFEMKVAAPEHCHIRRHAAEGVGQYPRRRPVGDGHGRRQYSGGPGDRRGVHGLRLARFHDRQTAVGRRSGGIGA